MTLSPLLGREPELFGIYRMIIHKGGALVL
jgi:hypothetical protein